MKLLKKERALKQESLGLEESRIKNIFPNLKHRFLKLGKEIHYSGIYTNFWLWNIIFANLAISLILFTLINRNYHLLPDKIGLNIDTLKGYDYIISKEVIYPPILIHIIISALTIIFVFRQGKKSNHLLIILLLNIFVLAFFEIKGITFLIDYFK